MPPKPVMNDEIIIDPNAIYTIRGASELLGLNARVVRNLCTRTPAALPSRKLGRVRVLSGRALLEHFAQQAVCAAPQGTRTDRDEL